jgi:hypothetical protein
MNSGPCKATLDFDATARRIVELTDLNLIRDQSMFIWNARGVVDIAKIDSERMRMMGPSASGPYIKRLDRALRMLDQP